MVDDAQLVLDPGRGGRCSMVEDGRDFGKELRSKTGRRALAHRCVELGTAARELEEYSFVVELRGVPTLARQLEHALDEAGFGPPPAIHEARGGVHGVLTEPAI